MFFVVVWGLLGVVSSWRLLEAANEAQEMEMLKI
jgi:hypothetical protein